jgi:hypothetical protein
MPPEQINEVFETMFSALRKTSGPDLSGVPAHAKPVVERTEPKKPTMDELKAAFDPSSDTFNPEAMVARIVDANYGGIVADISRNANAGLKNEIRSQLPDFKEYEADVDNLVSAMPAGTVNQGSYLQAYFTVKGFKQTQKEIADRAKPPTTVVPSAPRVEGDDLKMSQEDMDVARVMFRGAADPIAEYKKAAKMMESQNIRVPGDAPRKP